MISRIARKALVEMLLDGRFRAFDDESLADVFGRVGTRAALMRRLALLFGAGAWWRLRRFPVV